MVKRELKINNVNVFCCDDDLFYIFIDKLITSLRKHNKNINIENLIKFIENNTNLKFNKKFERIVFNKNIAIKKIGKIYKRYNKSIIIIINVIKFNDKFISNKYMRMIFVKFDII